MASTPLGETSGPDCTATCTAAALTRRTAIRRPWPSGGAATVRTLIRCWSRWSENPKATELPDWRPAGSRGPALCDRKMLANTKANHWDYSRPNCLEFHHHHGPTCH
jgi:hypothetical protein